jgi:putative transposase
MLILAVYKYLKTYEKMKSFHDFLVKCKKSISYGYANMGWQFRSGARIPGKDAPRHSCNGLLRKIRDTKMSVSGVSGISRNKWHGLYHRIYVGYWLKIREGSVGKSMAGGIRAIRGVSGCEPVELNLQKDPVHLLAMIPLKLSISGARVP